MNEAKTIPLAQYDSKLRPRQLSSLAPSIAGVLTTT